MFRAGYYSVNVKPDLRVISLQTNFCNKENWLVVCVVSLSVCLLVNLSILLFRWLLINSTDPGDMLKWLIDELLDAEKKGEKVHIIGHISPGSTNCLDAWNEMYHHILWRSLMYAWPSYITYNLFLIQV